MPGIVKIGATDRDPAERLHEANESDTWRPPEAYRIAWASDVDAPFIVEKRIHAAFAALRINPRREFFRITADEARPLSMVLALVARPLAIHSEPAEPTRLPAQSETEEGNARASYEAHKARFELLHFKTMDTLPFHTIDAASGSLTSRSKKAFTVAYMDWMRDGKQFLDKWYADPDKRLYHHIEYGCVKKEDQKSTVYYAHQD
jgi:hypothetical protein